MILFDKPDYEYLAKYHSYVIDKKGVVQLIFDSTSAKIHIEKALEILKTI